MNRLEEVYKYKYEQALRILKVENVLILILMGLSIVFGFIGLQWGIGISNLLLIFLVVFQLIKINRKIKEEKKQ